MARYVATGELTNGRFGLFEWDMPHGTGGTPAGRSLSEDEWAELWARYDQYRA